MFWKTFGPKIIMLVVVVALLAIAYERGHSSGHESGYKEGWDAQQETVDGLTKQINDKARAVNEKVTALEAKAADDSETIRKVSAASQKTRVDIVTEFMTRPVMVPVPGETKIVYQCGLSAEAVLTVNSLLDNMSPLTGDFVPKTSPPDASPVVPKEEPAK